MQNNYASAGNAIENSSQENPIGLYRHPQAKTEMGFLEPAGADAAVRLGYVLVKAGREAAESAGKKQAAQAASTQTSSPAPSNQAAQATATQEAK